MRPSKQSHITSAKNSPPLEYTAPDASPSRVSQLKEGEAEIYGYLPVARASFARLRARAGEIPASPQRESVLAILADFEAHLETL